MNNDIGVITIPIGVGERGLPLGLTISPLVASTLAKNLDAVNVLGINTFDTYKENRERFIPKYLKQLEEMKILPDAVWHDRREKEKVLDVIRQLEEKGYIKREKRQILQCECGKVEILEESPTRDEARLYKKNNDEIECKECGRLRKIEKDVLTMEFPKNCENIHNLLNVNKNEFNELMERINGMTYLISRERNTGIEYDGFNIDVDFVFLNFLNTMNFKHNIIVGSNHINWHLCMAAVLKQCLDEESNVYVLATPYVYDREKVLPEITEKLEGNPELKKVFLYSSLTWRRINTNWSTDNLRILEKCSVEELEKIIEYVEKTSDQEDILRIIKDCLSKMKKDTIMKLQRDNKRSNGGSDR